MRSQETLPDAAVDVLRRTAVVNLVVHVGGVLHERRRHRAGESMRTHTGSMC
jgi:hypothetical protein